MPDMDKGALYRMAASYLGEAECKAGTPVYAALDEVAQHAISLALDYTAWSFALARVELELESDGSVDLPSDCLEIRECSLPTYKLIGRTLYNTWGGGAATVTLVYKSSALADTVCLPDYAPFFCEGCALLVASKAAPRVNSRWDLAGDLESRAYQSLYRAKLKEARSTNSNDQKPRIDY